MSWICFGAIMLPAAAGISVPSNPQPRVDARQTALAMEAYVSGIRAATNASTGGRSRVRLLYAFEDGRDGRPVKAFTRLAQKLDVITVLDNGVTEGRQCARLTGQAGAEYCRTTLRGGPIDDWSDFDYFAMDLYTEEKAPVGICVELWDELGKDYAMRCSLWQTTRPGKQTLLYPINRTRRNGKEGREWDELLPEDKIDLAHLRQVRIFFTPPKHRPAVFWIDNVRLMQEDAARPKLLAPLPAAAAAAFDFGPTGAVVPGFEAATPQTRYAPGAFGFVRTQNATAAGTGWPDLLSGTFVTANAFTFTATVPNGAYRIWLCGGPTLAPEYTGQRFLLRVNDQTLLDERPTYDDYDGEQFLYRFLWTQYSQRPHALWLDYIDRMYPVHDAAVVVSNGVLTLTGRHAFVSALVAVPASAADDFDRMAAKLRQRRIEAFEALTTMPTRPAAAPRGDDEDFVVYVPDPARGMTPWTQPSDAERRRTQLKAAGAPGQNVFMRLAVAPFQELGACELMLSDLAGLDGRVIPAAAIQGHYVNYRIAERDVEEMILLPALSLYVEAGITQCFWLWLRVPDDAAPGDYSGTFTFRTDTGAARSVPVAVEVYPFRLEAELPLALGMYYGGRSAPHPPADRLQTAMLDQMRWMRRIGFTSLTVDGPSVRGVNVSAGQVAMAFDDTMAEAAKAAGLGRTADQPLLLSQLGIARAIARRLPAIEGPMVDQQPGIELAQDAFKPLWMDAMRQFKQWLETLGVSYAIEIVDEPREVPNPWNRNLADTVAYGRWMGDMGLRRFVTPMGDVNGGKDYTPLVETTDIVSVHASPTSHRLMERAREEGKTLWIYNNGMGRLVWGAYLFAHDIRGQFQWHWCWPEGNARGGYPGSEWYDPFTASHALAPNAPLARYPGGFLYQSAYLTVADGITDYAYFYTLKRRAAAARERGEHADAVARADALLTQMRRDVPPFPVGRELHDATARLDDWRAAAAELLKEFR